MQKTSDVFDERNDAKKYLESVVKSKNVKPGQIWICKVGVNVGSEVSKDGDFSRPVLVLKTHLGGDLVCVIPLTSKFHENHAYQYVFFEDWGKYGLAVPSYFLLNQVRTISMKRLTRVVNDCFVDGVYCSTVPRLYRADLEQKIMKFMFLL